MTLTGIVKAAGMAALVTTLALSLAGCGRRGDLENPSAKATPAATSAPGTSPTATSTQTREATKPIAPKQSFVLDPLL